MISVPVLHKRRIRGLFAQKLQHAIPAFVVLGDGIAHLSHVNEPLDLWLGGAEVLVGVLVIGSVIRGFRALRRLTADTGHDAHMHHGIDWIDLMIGAMLGVEAYAKYHATQHLPRPTIVLAVAMIVMGLLHGRIAAWGERRRLLRVGEDGISIPKRLSRVSLTWADVASIEVDERRAVIATIDGRSHTITFGDLLQPNAVRDALTSAQTRLGEARHAAAASIESTAEST